MIDSKFIADKPEDVGIDPGQLDALFDRAAREIDEGLLPSAQIAVARHGQIAGMRCYGDASDDSLYHVFSSTKAVSSAAAWLLIQEGKLRTDEVVGEIVPEFATNGKEAVTVEQLMTHTAGFPQAPYPQAEWQDRHKRLERFGKWRTVWEPSTRFEYHPTSSMWVLGEIIERRSGVDFADFVRDRIGRPLGLEDLRVGCGEDRARRVKKLELVGEELTEADFKRLGFPVPQLGEVTPEMILGFNRPEVRDAHAPGASGVMSAAELALFYQGLLHGGALDGPKLWSDETLGSALKVRTGELTDPVFHKRVHRALGVCVAGDKERTYRGFGHTNSPLAFGHGGAGGQIAWGDPETGISLGYVTNGYDRNPIRMARRGVGLSSRAASCATPS